MLVLQRRRLQLYVHAYLLRKTQSPWLRYGAIDNEQRLHLPIRRGYVCILLEAGGANECFCLHHNGQHPDQHEKIGRRVCEVRRQHNTSVVRKEFVPGNFGYIQVRLPRQLQMYSLGESAPIIQTGGHLPSCHGCRGQGCGWSDKTGRRQQKVEWNDCGDARGSWMLFPVSSSSACSGGQNKHGARACLPSF